MKIKRLLAFVLAGTLCLSETAWALPDNGVGGVDEQSYESVGKQLGEPPYCEDLLSEPESVSDDESGIAVEIIESEAAAYEDGGWDDEGEFYQETAMLAEEESKSWNEEMASDETDTADEDASPRLGLVPAIDDLSDMQEYEVASSSNAPAAEDEPNAADYAATIGINSLAGTNELSAASDEYKMVLKTPAEDKMYAYMPVTVEITRTRKATDTEASDDNGEVTIEVKRENGSFANPRYNKKIVCAEGITSFTIPGESFYDNHSYLIDLVGPDNKSRLDKPLELTVKELKDIEITLKGKYFKRTYLKADPSSFTLNAGEFDAWKDGVQLASKFKIENIKYEYDKPEAASERPGKYAIKSLQNDTYGTIKLKSAENIDYNWFYIEKAEINISIFNSKIEVTSDGMQKAVSLAKFFSVGAGDTKAVPTSVVDLEKIDAETLNNLQENTKPEIKDGKIVFCPGKSDKEYQLKIPVNLENDYYTYYCYVTNSETQKREKKIIAGVSLLITACPRTVPAPRSADEIRKYYNSHQFSLTKRFTMKVPYDAKNSIAGAPADEDVRDALNAFNLVRYIAGLNEVTINPQYAEWCQTGATLLTEVKKLTHTPAKPSTVTDEFYKIGKKGTSESNIASGYTNLADAVITGWMEDGDAGNISVIGHRRWCLDPNMQQTGFGHSGNYEIMYSWDSYNQQKTDDWYKYDYIMWPAANMPIDYFYGPWNVNLNSEFYNVPDSSKVKVTLVQNGKTGSTVTLDSSNKDKYGKYFNVTSAGYGYGQSIIFEPMMSINAGDSVQVTISGLTDPYGNPEEISYTVNFFPMEERPLKSITLNETSRTMTVDSSFQLKIKSLTPTNPSNAKASDVEWSSSNPDVAEVESDGMVIALSPGNVVITASIGDIKATCKITVKRSSSSGGGGGGSSSGGGGGGGGGVRPSGSQKSAGPAGAGASANLPDYVVRGAWTQTGDVWTFSDANGVAYVNRWAAVYNPYANTAIGQSNYDWFWFDPYGRMMTGWHLDADGNYYYLNEASDGTRGRMVTGWFWIKDADGVQRCYYFDPVADTGTRGKMMRNTVVDGYQIDANGHWVVNGVVQTK